MRPLTRARELPMPTRSVAWTTSMSKCRTSRGRGARAHGAEGGGCEPAHFTAFPGAGGPSPARPRGGGRTARSPRPPRRRPDALGPQAGLLHPGQNRAGAAPKCLRKLADAKVNVRAATAARAGRLRDDRVGGDFVRRLQRRASSPRTRCEHREVGPPRDFHDVRAGPSSALVAAPYRTCVSQRVHPEAAPAPRCRFAARTLPWRPRAAKHFGRRAGAFCPWMKKACLRPRASGRRPWRPWERAPASPHEVELGLAAGPREAVKLSRFTPASFSAVSTAHPSPGLSGTST